LTVAPDIVTAGDSVAIAVDVLNNGSVPGSYLAELKINGTVEDSKEVNLAEGAGITVSFNVTKDIVGVYTVEIGGRAGTFIVSKPPIGLRWSLIGGIITAVLIAGLSGTFIIMRRRGLA
jgi:hypothetical protein